MRTVAGGAGPVRERTLCRESPGRVLLKSGGNTFSGRHEATIEDHKLEGNNLTDLIRSQGTTNPQLLLTALDLADNVGGPVKQNKWWFFGAYHLNRSRRTALGYLLPDGKRN
jgi:hypothetical protein